MGKKKTQKTKQISVAIAEISTSKLPDDGGGHGGGQSVQPRKRGRPRKVLDEPPDDKKLLPPPPADVADKPLQKKGKSTGDEPPISMEGASKQHESEEPKSGDGSRSRGRRKNKPRKSS
ncbi:uncharacterized protein LOC111798433 [Cucurbita pepo subsp. pepo]|uniref:uncharacterized protein LOC111798433 n=1 Tax=Cucurbita pepo subsp. pepo TaxID=3664 RepID=UPI000C9D2A30|nr:uncharacterized protein LOC111798433 [Cucurbita pepo subsp. pepo]